MKKADIIFITTFLSLLLFGCSAETDNLQQNTQTSYTSTVYESQIVTNEGSKTPSDASPYQNSDEISNEAEKQSFPDKTESEHNETDGEAEENIMLQIKVNGYTLKAKFTDNSSARELMAKLKDSPITIDMHDYGSFEKVGALPFELPTNDTYITTEPGDIILYQGNQLTVYYDVNSWSFTHVAKIIDTDSDTLKQILGSGDVTVEFSLRRI